MERSKIRDSRSLPRIAPGYDVSALRRRALRLRPAQRLVEPGNDFDKIARPRAVVELVRKNAAPAVTAGAGRSRQAKEKRGTRRAGGGAALDRRGADLG